MGVTRYRDVSEMPPAWFDPSDPRLPQIIEELMRLALSINPPKRRGLVRLELASPEEGGGFREVEEPRGYQSASHRGGC